MRTFLRHPALPVVLAALLLLAPVFLTGKALFWGTPLLQFVPWWNWAWETLRSGQLPLWNPLLGMGAPLIANYQSALFYPPNWIYFLLAALGGLPALAWGQALLLALHLAWAGLGMVTLVRRLGLGWLPQAIGGLSFGLSSYLVARSGFLSINSAAAWLPWILLAGYDLVRAEQPSRAGMRFGLLAGLQLLAGHAQIAWYTLLLSSFWAAYWAWASAAESSGLPRKRLSWRQIGMAVGRAELRLGLAWLLAAGLAAVQLLPTAEYLQQSQRASAVDFDYAMNYSTWPWRLLSLLAPNLFGNPVQGDYWGYGYFWEDAFYLGLLPLFLALAAILRARASSVRLPDGLRRIRMPAFLGCVTLLSILFAMGKNTPVFPWLYRHVPTFNMFQAPARYLIWAAFCLALLAALGAAAWRRPQGRSLYWTRLGTAGAVAVSLGAGLAWYFLREVKATFIAATALAGLWGIAAGTLSLTAPQAENDSQQVTGWHWAVVLVIAADLLVAGWGLNPGTDLRLYREASPTAQTVQDLGDGGRLFLLPQDEENLKFDRFMTRDTYQAVSDWQEIRAVMLPNTALLDRQASANNFDPLVPARYAEWMQFLRQVQPANLTPWLNLMGVHVVEKVDSRQAHGVTFSSVEYPITSNLPTAWTGRLRWTPCAEPVANGQAAWQRVTSGSVDFNQVVILEGEALAAQPALGCQPAAQPDFELVEAGPNQISVQLTTSRPGWLVLSDTWYPGWRARLDGQPVEILRANYLFRAVELPAGEHEIQMEYRPFSFYFGLAISLLLGAICLLAAIRWQRMGVVRG